MHHSALALMHAFKRVARRAGNVSGVGHVFKTAQALRAACREGTFSLPTSGHAPGHVQANLVILRGENARDFEAFCRNNAAPCPLLEVTSPGSYEATRLAPGSDVRKDLPKYHVWRDGVMTEEREDVTDLCDTGNMQAFLLGCSFSWEDALASAQLTPRHMEEGHNVPMYNTSIRLKGAGPFEGNMVVSMRPYRPSETDKVVEITKAYPAAHGRPVHVGHPESIGIDPLLKPDYGDSVVVRDGEVPHFWACGVTPQNALRNARLPFAITHAPGHMFVADILSEQLKTWEVPGKWSARPCEE